MIDRTARDKAAEILRQFFSGRFTNFEFENRFPSSKDPAIWAIEDTVWCFYDDIEPHHMTGVWKLNEEWKSIIARWVMFLHTNNEYSWPKISYPGVRPLKFTILRGRERRFLAYGQHEFWPFKDKESYERAKEAPVLLAGT